MIHLFFKKTILIAFFTGVIVPLSPAQTWEIYDEDFTLLKKIENEKIMVLGTALRLSDWGSSFNLLGTDYEPIVNIENSEIFQYLEPWVIISEDGKLGAYHEYGEKIFETEYDEIDTYYNLLLARQGIAFFLYDRGKREERPLGSYQSAYIAKNGQVIAEGAQGYYLPLSDDPTYRYDSLISVSENVIISKEATGYGLINRDGNHILEPVIDEINYMGDEFFFAKNGKEYLLIKAMTNRADIKYTSYHQITIEDDVILEYIHGRLRRVMKRDGILLDAVGLVSVVKTGAEHFTVTFRDGKIGLLDKNGRWEVSPTDGVQALFPGGGGLNGALIDGKYGFVDRNGVLRIANRYEEIGKFSEGFAPVKIGQRWGYIDQNDRISIQPRFQWAGEFVEGVAIVRVDGKANLIDSNGNELLADYYDRISITDDRYYLTENDGMFGLADSRGAEICIPKFDELRREGKDRILIRRGNKYGIMKETGEYSLPIYYTNIIFDQGNQRILAEEEYIAPTVAVEESESVKKSNKKGT